MASPNISIGTGQTNFPSTFFTYSDGVTQGSAFDDPAYRYALLQGWVSSTVTQPMWGGLAISTSLPPTAPPPNPNVGDIIIPATAVPGSAAGSLTGFTVFNQSNAMILTASSPVPMAPSNSSINYYPLGCRARIPFACSAAAATAWAAGITTPATLYWDTANLWFTNASGTGIIGPITGPTIFKVLTANCRTVNYSSSTNTATWNENAAAVVLVV